MSDLKPVACTQIDFAEGEVGGEINHWVTINFSAAAPGVLCEGEGGSCENGICYYDCTGSSDLSTLTGTLRVNGGSSEESFEITRSNGRICLRLTTENPGVGTWTANDPGQGEGGYQDPGCPRSEKDGGHGEPAAHPVGHR